MGTYLSRPITEKESEDGTYYCIAYHIHLHTQREGVLGGGGEGVRIGTHTQTKRWGGSITLKKFSVRMSANTHTHTHTHTYTHKTTGGNLHGSTLYGHLSYLPSAIHTHILIHTHTQTHTQAATSKTASSTAAVPCKAGG